MTEKISQKELMEQSKRFNTGKQWTTSEYDVMLKFIESGRDDSKGIGIRKAILIDENNKPMLDENGNPIIQLVPSQVQLNRPRVLTSNKSTGNLDRILDANDLREIKLRQIGRAHV